jgi:glyoxylase-like metal-dependent hydrolase (beta-lactamase superfamily II)
MIAEREKGNYPYDLDIDISEWGPTPALYPLEDEQIIDLGNRKVTVYACPGHTAGSITFLDEKSRILFLGDAVNCNLGLGGGEPGTPKYVPIEKALSYLKRLHSLRDRYDGYYNGHYDYRPLGEPLGEDVLPDAIIACETFLDGTAAVEMRPFPFPGRPDRPMVKVGRTMVFFRK